MRSALFTFTRRPKDFVTFIRNLGGCCKMSGLHKSVSGRVFDGVEAIHNGDGNPALLRLGRTEYIFSPSLAFGFLEEHEKIRRSGAHPSIH